MAISFRKINFINLNALKSIIKPMLFKFKGVKSAVIKIINARIVHPLKINNTSFGGPKKALLSFKEIDDYVDDKKSKGLNYFYWHFFGDKITIKNPEYTIGTPLPGAEVPGYVTLNTEYVYAMPNVRIYSKYFFTLTEDNYLLAPVSNVYGDERKSHPAFGTLFLPKCKKLKGRSIIVRGGAYWHKMQDGLPALYLAELAGFNFDAIDHFIIQDQNISQNSIFTRVGIPLEKQVRLYDESDCYLCDELIFSSWYDRKGNWYKDYLDRIIQPKLTERIFPEKIYLSRSRVNTRKVLNEDAVIGFLKNYGFECIHNEDLTTDEQIALFKNATHIVSCHGSQLTNIIFCKPGTKVCEIRHISHAIHYRKAFHDLSNGFGLKYYLLYTALGEKFYDENNQVVDTDTHMYINLDEMQLMLEKMDLKPINC
ncbi:MAG: glycosyltransferase family 61 protein [Sphingobacteriaceae bacterium]|nr:MAG: glycosyltransferase family 61 protein [Sphingobacteriaceae bacterium]